MLSAVFRSSIPSLCAAGVSLLSSGLYANLDHPAIYSLGDLNQAPVPMQVTGPGATAQGVAYFAASDSEYGTEVWRCSSSSATLFRDARPGPESSNPSQFTRVGNYVVYVADDGVHGPELFTSANISPSGLLADVQPGATHAAPTILGASNGNLWFTTPSTSPNPSQRPATELWVTNGTSPPLKRGYYAENSISNVTLLPTASGLTRSGIVFIARPHGVPAGYAYLWRSNGGSVSLIDNLRSSPSNPLPNTPVYAVTTNFVCYQRFDGSPPRVYNFSGGSSILDTVEASTPASHFVSNGTDTVCFAAASAAAGREVWKTNGTAASTALLADVTPGAASSNPTDLMMSLGNPGVFFQVESGGGHRDLYFADTGAAPAFKKYDSWVENTQQPTIVSAKEIAYVKPESSFWQVKLADGVSGSSYNLGGLFNSVTRMWNSSISAPMDSSLRVVGSTSTHGEELYQRSGATLEPLFLATAPHSDSATPRHFFSFVQSSDSRDQLFVADTSSEKGRMYCLRSGSLSPVTQTHPTHVSNNSSSLPDNFTEVDGALYFTASDGQNRRLFQAATVTAHSASTVLNIFDPEQLVAFQNRLFLLAHDTAGGTGVKQLFQVMMSGEGAHSSLVSVPIGFSATALKPAAGRLFFVEEIDSSSERLHSIDSGFTVTTIGTFYNDAAGTGITQLTASSGHLYFTGRSSSSPTAPRLIWGTDGTHAGLVSASSSILNPQLLGSLGDSCVFWTDPGNNSTYDALIWNSDSGNPPSSVYSGPVYDTPERHRLASKPSGIEVDGRFYFTTQKGNVMETDGTGAQTIFDDSSLLVRPESLSSLSGKLLFMATAFNNDCQLFAYSVSNGVQQLWSTPAGSLPCPMVEAGGRLYFTSANLDSANGVTNLWRTDGTNAGTALIKSNLVSRNLSNVAMGTFRGHLMLGAAISTTAGLEPVLLNHRPVIPALSPLTGGLRNQPFHFTYEQIVGGPPTDPDGDPLSPLRFYPGEGIIKINGVHSSFSVEIFPGDGFDWTPPEGMSGSLHIGSLSITDDWLPDAWEPIYLEVKTPHDLWAQSRFTPEELADYRVSAPESDANGNGIPNAFEFIFARDPKSPDTTPGWSPSIATPPGGGAPVRRFTFTRAATLAEGTVLKVLCSPDLTALSWTSIATKTENTPWDSAASTVTEETQPDGRVEVHVDVPVDSPCAFFRLSVDL